MPTLLLTNDDGIDSPTLVPLAKALERLGTVRIVVPECERSWIGKAISRFEPVHLRTVERDGLTIRAVMGTPADCASLGMHELFPQPPDLVVSGINLGLNFGTAFVLSSGTVGAAIEAALGGVPGIAFSMAIPSDAYGLAGAARAALIGPRCAVAAATAFDITRTLWEHGFPAGIDVFSVNLPAEVTPSTPRRVTHTTRARYGPVFVRAADDHYVHHFRWYRALEEAPGGDIATVNRGWVSITPLRLDLTGAISEQLQRALEEPPGPFSK